MTRGRHPAPRPPAGRVTLAQAAEMSGLSYGQVRRRVVERLEVDSRTEAGGVITIARRDVKRLKPRAATVDHRLAVTLRVSREEWAEWSRVAGDRTVSAWLLELARSATRSDRH